MRLQPDFLENLSLCGPFAVGILFATISLTTWFFSTFGSSLLFVTVKLKPLLLCLLEAKLFVILVHGLGMTTLCVRMALPDTALWDSSNIFRDVYSMVVMVTMFLLAVVMVRVAGGTAERSFANEFRVAGDDWFVKPFSKSRC